MSDQIKCNNVRYRQGFVEVANIHAGFVNLEVWNVHPDKGIETVASIASGAMQDADVTGNTELELSIEQTKQLVQLLQTAIVEAERGAPNAA